MILTSESTKDLAKKIATKLKLPLLCVESTFHSNKEVSVCKCDCKGDVIAFFPNYQDFNRNLILFLLMIKDLQNIVAVIPYIPYSRQDKDSGLSVIARILENAGINRIITIDIHSKKAANTFNIPITNIDSFDIFEGIYKEKDDIVFVAPDVGARERASVFAEKLNKNIVFIDKNNKTISDTLIIQDKKCIIIDDIVDSGKTLDIASKILCENGAKSIEACVTHGIVSSIGVISPKIDTLYISESIVPFNVSENIRQISIFEVLSRTILKYMVAK